MHNSDETDQASLSAWVGLYQTASQQWAHAEQIRWTLLYNYLMASTILLLAWAAVFASSDRSVTKAGVLVLLALGGVALSSLWVALGARATGFVRTYAAAGEKLEVEFIKAANIAPPNSPFAVAREHRRDVKGIARQAPSSFVLWIVPTVFLLLYNVLSWVSLGGAGSFAAPAGRVVVGIIALASVVFVCRAYHQVFPDGRLEQGGA